MNKRKILKVVKWIVGVSASVYVFFILLFTYNCSGWSQLEEDGAFRIYYHKWSGNVLVGDYCWDGDENNMTVTIPDEADGKKINSLGGFIGRGAPLLFRINLPDSIEKNGEYNFTVKLGENIKQVYRFLYIDEFTDINGESICVINYYYEVSENNKWIYSKDGKLYDKKTDELLGITSG